MARVLYLRAFTWSYGIKLIRGKIKKQNMKNHCFCYVFFTFVTIKENRPGNKAIASFMPFLYNVSLPLPPQHTCMLRRNTLTADNLYITDITSTGESRVSFNLYARLDGGILNGSALATAVLVRVFPCYTMESVLMNCSIIIILCAYMHGCICLNLPTL